MALTPLLVPKGHSWGTWFMPKLIVVQYLQTHMRALKKPDLAIGAMFCCGLGLSGFPT